jgi:iron complex outermembrane receptor protein
MKKPILCQFYWRQALLVIVLFMLSVVATLAQTISGKVTSAKGETLPGVNIVVKGTTKGTTTDKNGQFSLEARKAQVIIFSFVGYQLQEVTIGDQTQLNITLQDAAESLEEVVVTAENRSVSAQRVPITLDLVTGKNIQKQGITDLLQLQAAAPSLNIVTNTIFNQINIRGVGSNDGANEMSDQAVTVGIDGEYLNRPIALNAAMFDLDRVEVLKGPQGTLYGRNATAGAVNIIAKKPTQNREVEVGANVGNYGTLKLNGAVNLPLGKIAAIRVAGLLSKHDGYRESSGTGAFNGRIDNGNFWAARAGLDINPTKNLNIYLAGEMNKTDQQAPSQYGVALGNIAELKNTVPKNWTTTLPNDFPVATAGFMKIDQSAIRGRIAYNFGKANLSYTGGVRKVDMTGYQPLNGFVPETFSFHNDLSYNTQSHELRLNGESAKLSWQVGGFYGKENQDVRRGLFLPSAAGAFGGQIPFLNFFFRDVTSTTAAIFGQATYNVNEKLGFTLGLRNTSDKKTRSGGDLASAPFGPPTIIRFFYPNVPTSPTQAGIKPLTGVMLENSWNQTTWTAGMEYKADANKMIFAKVSKGYKAGGFDNVGEYDPESLIAYEIGTKNKFVNNKLRLNASLFYYDYTNQQVSVFINTAVGGGIKNAGQSSVTGLDIETEYAISKSDRIKLTANFLDAKFKTLRIFTNITVGGAAATEQILDGNRPVQAPPFTFSGRYDHDFKVGKGTLNAGVQLLYKADYYLQPYNMAMDKQEAYTKTDVNLTYTTGNGKFDIGVYAQNLEDNRIKTYASLNGGTINIYNWIFGTPRTVGIQANLHF